MGSVALERAQGPARTALELEADDLRELRQVHQADFCDSVPVRDSDGDVVKYGIDSQAGCGHELVPRTDPKVFQNEDGQLYLWGVKRCGSAWGCPVCSSRISRRKGAELQRAIDAHRDQGGAVYFITATLPHHAGHELHEVSRVVRETWRYLKSGSPWGRWADRMGYVGAVRGIDTTVGAAGWHQHIHAILFVERELPSAADLLERYLEGAHLRTAITELGLCDDEDQVRRVLESHLPDQVDGEGRDRSLEELVAWMRDRWCRKVEAWYQTDDGALEAWPLNRRKPDVFHPYFGECNRSVAVHVQRGHQAGRYVAKMGLGRAHDRVGPEVADTASKRARGGNRTPLEVLVDYAEHGREEDARLWRTWVGTMHGAQHVSWSQGLKDRLLEPDDQEPETDDELAEREVEESDELVVQVDRHLWGWMRARAGPGIASAVFKCLRSGGIRELFDLFTALAPDGVEVRMSEREKRLWAR